MKKLFYILSLTIAGIMFLGFSIGVVQAGPCELPVFDANNFDTNVNSPTYSANITNSYFPLVVGTTFIYEPVPNEEDVVDTMVVTNQIKTITVDSNNIDCRQVHDYETVGGVISEDTLDWYAQDFEGNVWYCGEDTTAYLEGGGIDKTGSWEAGKDILQDGRPPAEPGYVMLAEPRVGLCYQQEFYEDEAQDEAKIMRLNAKVALENGNSYEGCLETKEWSPLERGAIEQKIYAEGVGLVLNFEHQGKRVRNELIEKISP